VFEQVHRLHSLRFDSLAPPANTNTLRNLSSCFQRCFAIDRSIGSVDTLSLCNATLQLHIINAHTNRYKKKKDEFVAAKEMTLEMLQSQTKIEEDVKKDALLLERSIDKNVGMLEDQELQVLQHHAKLHTLESPAVREQLRGAKSAVAQLVKETNEAMMKDGF
jgi:hypothetical protein